MLRSLNSAISGLQSFQTELDVIGNNIANANTVGYKSARMDFHDAFSQTLQAGGGGRSSMQVGSGVGAAAITNMFGQGPLSGTGNQTDLAISGDGFFLLRDSASGKEFVTRAGNFHLDSDGYLTSTEGFRVRGYSDSGLSAIGDLRIDATGAPATAAPDAKFDSFAIDKEGRVMVRLTDGTTFARGQVLLQNVTNPQALLKEGENLYSGLSLAGALASPVPPGQSGAGYLKASTLELSNVDLTREFSNLITTQRGFQANARVITTSDEVLQELVNLKR